MARKVSQIGPHVLALIEDARIDLARAVLALREGDNEPDFGLPTDVPDPSDEELAHAFRQSLLQILSNFDVDELRPAEQRSRRVLALAEGKGECPVFCVWLIGSMLPERSKDDDDFQRTAGRAAEGLQAA